jgi:hypothetical protein
MCEIAGWVPRSVKCSQRSDETVQSPSPGLRSGIDSNRQCGSQPTELFFHEIKIRPGGYKCRLSLDQISCPRAPSLPDVAMATTPSCFMISSSFSGIIAKFSCFLLNCGAPYPVNARHKIYGGDLHHGDDRCRNPVCQPRCPEIRFGVLVVMWIAGCSSSQFCPGKKLRRLART